LKAILHQDTVFIDQWYDVGNRAQSNKVKIFSQVRYRTTGKESFIPQGFTKSHEQFKDYANTCKRIKWERAIVLLGIYNSISRRKHIGNLMVVCYNNIYTLLPGKKNLFSIRNATVNSDDKLSSLVL